MRAALSLVRALGPWADQAQAPADVARTEVERGGVRMFVYRPTRRPIEGAWLLAQGLHYLGPEDARMDRFARVLAAAGRIVVAPFLSSYLALKVELGVVDELGRGLEHLLEVSPDARPAVFSISFGSMPALHLAADPTLGARLDAVVVFGGFCDFSSTLSFVLGEDGATGPRDPLNVPAAMLNLLDSVDEPAHVKETAAASWRAFAERTWGRDEMKRGGRHLEVARELSARIDDDRARRLFEIGVGLAPGAGAICREALVRDAARARLLDPRAHLERIRCRVHLFHGVDDDVIPHTQADLLAAALPPHLKTRAHKTGLYGHTGAGAVLARGPALVRELVTMARMLRVLATAGKTRA